jgi:hypothetical protein
LRLATSGRHIVEAATGKPLLLRGMNVSGMEYSHLPYAGMDPDELRLVVEGWNCDIIRIPFVQSRVSEPEYVEELKQVVNWLWDLGAFTILDLQWLSKESGVPPEPDLDSIACWDNLARSFNNQPHVIFDLLNEPHDVPLERWLEWAYLLTDTVRASDPERVVMVGGMDWAYDLRGVHLEVPNVIYSTHVYRNKGQQWHECFGHKTANFPVFAGEFGGHDEDIHWGRQLLDYFDQRQMGWTAWSWRDRPHLQHGGEATPFGQLVKSRLRSCS